MPAGLMKRIEIEGQYEPSNPFSAFKADTKYQIHRKLMPLEIQPSNWITFCDEVDEILQCPKMRQTKLIVKCGGIFLIVFVIMLIVPIHFVRKAIFVNGNQENGDDENDNTLNIILIWLGYSVSIGLFLTIYFIIWYRAFSTINTIFEEVGKVCTKHNMQNIVSYRIRDERDGGDGDCCCMKVCNRRLFLVVNIYDHSYDIEEQRQQQRRQSLRKAGCSCHMNQQRVDESSTPLTIINNYKDDNVGGGDNVGEEEEDCNGNDVEDSSSLEKK